MPACFNLEAHSKRVIMVVLCKVRAIQSVEIVSYDGCTLREFISESSANAVQIILIINRHNVAMHNRRNYLKRKARGELACKNYLRAMIKPVRRFIIKLCNVCL